MAGAERVNVADLVADLACVASMGRTETPADLSEAERVAYEALSAQAAKSWLRRSQLVRQAEHLRRAVREP